MNYKKLELQRAITEIESPYPKDDLIKSYADFLKVREFLRYYEFNPIVLNNLLELTINHWSTSKRISRLSLLERIKQYFHTTSKTGAKDYYDSEPVMIYEHTVETKRLLFILFRKVYEEAKFLTEKQLQEARRLCNNILIAVELSSEEEEWLCLNYSLSEQILNRILRYPIRSVVISNWAKKNFKNVALSSRRAELLSWIIDEEPNFEIDNATLVNDFEYLNQTDMDAIQNYEDEIEANRMMEQELGEYFPKKTSFGFFENSDGEERVDLSAPELKLSRRPYRIEIDTSKFYPVDIPNFEALKENFYKNIDTHQKITMSWAIGYSRLENVQKSTLLKKYYNAETYNSLFRVGKKIKNAEFLKWILEQQ